MNKRINLLYVIHSLENGGAEMLAIRLAELLDKSQFNVTVCSLADNGPLRELLVAKSIQHVTLGKRDGRDLLLVFRLARTIRDNKIDVIHTHNQGPLLYTYLARFFCLQGKHVHTEHISMAKELSYSRKHLLYNVVIYRALDGFVNIAEHLTREYRNKFNLVNAAVATIHNSVDLAKHDFSISRSLHEELGLQENAKIVGCIAALRPQKDQQTLIKAMVEVHKKVPEAVLLLAGDGELRPALERLVEELGINDHVRFLGYRSDVDSLLVQFDVFVLSSLYEGLPLCILEAMAAGRAIAATDADGTNELIEDGSTGLLVPLRQPEKLAEAIISLLSDPGLAQRLGKKAQEVVSCRYNMGTMIQQYQAYYRNLLLS